VLTLRNPRQQSGQEHIYSIYKFIAKLKRKCDKIIVVWLPSGVDDENCAKEKAKATQATNVSRRGNPITDFPL
jgi:hypothetical protein